RIFDRLWIQPASGDAGGALGAALFAWHQILDQPRIADGVHDTMRGAALGPGFEKSQIREFLESNGIPYRSPRPAERYGLIARKLSEGEVVALFQGRMEYGPRALGFRSILADARNPGIQSFLNLATK